MSKPSIKPVSFPKDGQAHDSIIEWWYFNGRLHDKSGKQYSFMDCLFKADLKRVKLPFLSKIPFVKSITKTKYIYFAHSIVSDIAHQKSYKEIQNISLVSRDSFTKPLMFANYIDPIIINGYTNCELIETSPFNFYIKTDKLELDLTSKKVPLLEGGHGHISVCGRKSYYYSLTDLHTKGKIKIENKWVEVEGRSWMDHQWADVAWGKEKWTWFSLQLDDGTDIMCVEYDDGKNKEYLVDILDSTGKDEHLKELILTPGKDVWQSKHTKAKYPMSWKIEIPHKKIKLMVESLLPDQEMIFGAINYWEGPLNVNGEISGKKVKGVGFMELVGYPADYNYLMMASKNIAKTFLNKII